MAAARIALFDTKSSRTGAHRHRSKERSVRHLRYAVEAHNVRGNLTERCAKIVESCLLVRTNALAEFHDRNQAEMREKAKRGF